MTEQTLYHFGDKARYTGKTEIIHGGLFYEIEYLEGHRKGQLIWTARKPADHPTTR